MKAYSTDILDYPGNLSMYEKESLVLKARLARERYKKKPSADRPGGAALMPRAVPVPLTLK